MKRKILTYIYRVFFIFDDGQIVVLFNGFQKKTQKTPTNEIVTMFAGENTKQPIGDSP